MWIHQDREALACGPFDRRRRACGHPNRRMRRLHGLWQHLDAVIAVVFSLVGEFLVRPRLQHDIDGLVEPRSALFAGNSEGFELAAFEAAPRAPVDAPTR